MQVFVRYFEKISFHSIAFSLVFDKKYNFSIYVLHRKKVSLFPGLEVMLFSSYCMVLAVVFMSMTLFKLSFILKWGQDQGLISSIQNNFFQLLQHQLSKSHAFSSVRFSNAFKKSFFLILYYVFLIYVLSFHHYHTIITSVVF